MFCNGKAPAKTKRAFSTCGMAVSFEGVDAMAEEMKVSAHSFASEDYDLEVLQMPPNQRPGFKEFILKNKESLEHLRKMRDERAVLEHLARNSALLEGVAHVRAWYFDRHVAVAKAGRLSAAVDDEAAGFFLLDAAADAARAHVFKTSNVKQAASVGVKMLSAGLASPDDPVGIRASLGARVEAWNALVKRAAAASQQRQQRQQLKVKSQQQMKSQQGQSSKVPMAAVGPAALESSMSSLTVSKGAAAAEPPVSTGSAPPEAAVQEEQEQPAEEEGGLGGLWKSWFG